MANNLAAITDINRIVHQINQGGYDIAPEQLYDRLLLDQLKLGEEHYVHLKHTESYTLPRGTKRLQKRRWGGLTAHTTPLREGIPPVMDKTSMEAITFVATQFGRAMEFTDRVDLDQIDPQIWHYTKELGDVMTRTKERYARETMLSAPSKLFAGNATTVGELKVGDVITIADLRYQTLRFDRLLVKPIEGSYFKYICSPEFLFDLVDDPLVDKYMQINNTTKKLFDDGKPFPLFRIMFVPTMLDEFYTPDLDHPGEWFDGTGYQLRVYAAPEKGVLYYGNIAGDNRTVAGTTTFLNDGTAITDKVNWDIKFEVGDKILKVDYNDSTETTYTIIENAPAGEGEITLAEVEAFVWGQLPIHKGILYGKEFLVRIGIAGEGDAKMYIKKLGSAGVNDPIDQRQTIGAKINSIGFGLLRPEAGVITYSVPVQAIHASGLTADIIKMAKTVVGKTEDNAGDMLEHREYTVDRKDLTKGTDKFGDTKPNENK